MAYVLENKIQITSIILNEFGIIRGHVEWIHRSVHTTVLYSFVFDIKQTETSIEAEHYEYLLTATINFKQRGHNDK